MTTTGPNIYIRHTTDHSIASAGFEAVATCQSGNKPIESPRCKPEGANYDYCTMDGYYNDPDPTPSAFFMSDIELVVALCCAVLLGILIRSWWVRTRFKNADMAHVELSDTIAATASAVTAQGLSTAPASPTNSPADSPTAVRRLMTRP